ncbi:MAG: Rpn family recombination-promoting nuclease/putative transposase [Thermoflexaceae bacterium]|nr:Rpn family recombination-promoting nuclease/putative transposase [Thermoflexaceae bacterium]
MGEPNNAITDYLQKKERLVSFCNYAVGEELFHVEDVEDKDGFYSDNGKNVLAFSQRDILRRMKLKGQDILVGVENQQNVNLIFPIRQLGMDYLEYRRNVEWIQEKNREKKNQTLYTKEDDFLYHFRTEDKILPILDIVLYWGRKEWKQPHYLQDMWSFNEFPDNVKKMLNNYKVNVIPVRKIPDKALERMKSDVKYVVGALKRSEDKIEYRRYIQENKDYFCNIPRSAAEVLNACTKMNERMVFQYQWDDKEREEVADMCKAWEDQFNDGVAEGVSRGRNQEKQDVIRNMLRMGMSDEIIRAVTECGQSMIDKLKIEAGIATLDAAR